MTAFGMSVFFASGRSDAARPAAKGRKGE